MRLTSPDSEVPKEGCVRRATQYVRSVSKLLCLTVKVWPKTDLLNWKEPLEIFKRPSMTNLTLANFEALIPQEKESIGFSNTY